MGVWKWGEGFWEYEMGVRVGLRQRGRGGLQKRTKRLIALFPSKRIPQPPSSDYLLRYVIESHGHWEILV